MKAEDLRLGDERWAYGHPLFSISSVRNDGLHVTARCFWFAFDTYDEMSWWVGQEVPGMVRFKTVGNTPVILTNETLPEYEPEPVSEVSRLKAWFSR